MTMLRLLAPLLVLASLVGCSSDILHINDVLGRIAVVVLGGFGLLGLGAVVSTIRGPRFGVVMLTTNILLGGLVILLTSMATDGFQPWRGMLTSTTTLLIWLLQPIASLAIVVPTRFAADRIAHPRRAWYLGGTVLVAYIGVLIVASTRVT